MQVDRHSTAIRPPRTKGWRRILSSKALLALVAIASISGITATVVAKAARHDLNPAAYWRQPLAPQGRAPADWTQAEASLSPEDCGGCHAGQLEQWRTSRHAQSFSPGLVGQLLTFTTQDTAECMQCHAPLAEQRAAFEAARTVGMAHRPDKQGLAAAGNSCAGCHLRGHRRFGPPQRDTAALGQSTLDTPHGGVFRTPFFETSDFCGACHQFPASLAVNGKPLENTVSEWNHSPWAREGRTCQGCHMPDRQHLWRGIHDPAMVASGLTPRVTTDEKGVRFEIINTGVGHAFPTYVTPRIVMVVVALDADGAPRPETIRSLTIARRVRLDGDRWVEVSDTRLLPGQSAVIDMPWNGSCRVRTWLDVFPDDYYENEVYRDLLQTLPSNGAPARLVSKAKADAATGHFRLFETDVGYP